MTLFPVNSVVSGQEHAVEMQNVDPNVLRDGHKIAVKTPTLHLSCVQWHHPAENTQGVD
jgi:hypothetical protein